MEIIILCNCQIQPLSEENSLAAELQIYIHPIAKQRMHFYKALEPYSQWWVIFYFIYFHPGDEFIIGALRRSLTVLPMIANHS